MLKISAQLLQTLQDSVAAHPILATAGATGLLGGALTAQTKQRPGETPGQRRLRILSNALLAAGAGGGAMAMGDAAVNQAKTALPPGDINPIHQNLISPVARAGYGAAAAVPVWTGLNSDIISTGKNNLTNRANQKLTTMLLAKQKPGTPSPGLTPGTYDQIRGMKSLDPSMLSNTQTGPDIRRALGRIIAGNGGMAAPSDIENELRFAGLAGGGPKQWLYRMLSTHAPQLATGIARSTPLMRTGLAGGAGALAATAIPGLVNYFGGSPQGSQ